MFPFWQKDRRAADLKIAVTVLSAVGAAVMAYLLRLHFSTDGSSFCNFSAAFSCDLVNQSAYSELFGIPVSLLGLGFFLVAPGMLHFGPRRGSFATVLLLTVFALSFSLVLSGIEVFVLRSICLFCETAKALMIGIIGLSAYGAGLSGEKMKWFDILLMMAAGTALGVAIFGGN